MSTIRARLTRVVLPAVLATAVGLAVLSGSPAQARADSWSVPGEARLTIKGHGFGHGHGMSQWGAEGAARQGVGYRRIIAFYYPGTRWGRASGPVKVLISADTSRDVVVSPRPGLKVRRVGAGRARTLGKARPAATRWRITPGPGGTSVVSYRTRGWHVLTRLSGDAEFSAGGRPVTLHLPGNRRVAYRGALRSASSAGGGTERDTVNVLPLDTYLQGVVPQEVPASWHAHAVRAQAVAARTYAAYERAHPLASHYQICDTQACQVYGGAGAEHPRSNAAVRATRHQVRLSGGEPAFTQFSASSGGWTSAGAFSYLPAQKDPWDRWTGNPNRGWAVPFTDRELERTWPALGNLTRIAFSGRDGHGQWGGRVGQVTLTGSRGTVRMSGDDFRFALNLRSTWMNVTVG